jgi:hypothetical protein
MERRMAEVDRKIIERYLAEKGVDGKIYAEMFSDAYRHPMVLSVKEIEKGSPMPLEPPPTKRRVIPPSEPEKPTVLRPPLKPQPSPRRSKPATPTPPKPLSSITSPDPAEEKSAKSLKRKRPLSLSARIVPPGEQPADREASDRWTILEHLLAQPFASPTVKESGRLGDQSIGILPLSKYVILQLSKTGSPVYTISELVERVWAIIFRGTKKGKLVGPVMHVNEALEVYSAGIAILLDPAMPIPSQLQELSTSA